MTLEILDIEQGTEEWHAARRGILTASVIGRLITPSTVKVADNLASRPITMQLAAERITEYTEPTYESYEMAMGHTLEPIARDLYSEHVAPVVECGFMVRTEPLYRIGYSPDGLVGDDGLLEVKSRDQKAHLTTIATGKVPNENLAQLQGGIYVSGRAWIDYWSYCPGMRPYRIRVYPDAKWQAAIPEAARRFEVAVDEIRSTYARRTHGMPETERDELATEMRL